MASKATCRVSQSPGTLPQVYQLLWNDSAILCILLWRELMDFILSRRLLCLVGYVYNTWSLRSSRPRNIGGFHRPFGIAYCLSFQSKANIRQTTKNHISEVTVPRLPCESRIRKANPMGTLTICCSRARGVQELLCLIWYSRVHMFSVLEVSTHVYLRQCSHLKQRILMWLKGIRNSAQIMETMSSK
jgi:hypothetical protein